MGGDGICTSELPKLADKAIGNNRVFCAEAGGVVGPFEQKMAEFRERFQKETGAEVKLYAPYVYDAVMVMVEAMKKANSTDPKKYLPELAKIQYEGVTGPIAFDEKGDIKGGTLTLFTYKGEKRETLKVIQ
jgi:branched-chain amino acid transport system substrate-binding protein